MPDAGAQTEGSPVCRVASDADHAAVSALRQALGRGGDAQAWVADQLRGSRSAPDTQALFVADVGERVVGYAVAQHFEWGPGAPPNRAPSGFYLAGIFVEPSERLRGAGIALVRARLRWIADRSRVAYYYANDDNLGSIALHEKLGFRPLMRSFAHPWVRDPSSIMTLYLLEDLVDERSLFREVTDSDTRTAARTGRGSDPQVR